MQKKERNLISIINNFFQLDNSSNDQCPDVEVTFSNLNDSIDTVFLTDLVSEYIEI